MKKYLIVSLLLLAASGCGLNEEEPQNPNDLGGSTDIPLSKVGNEYGVYVTVDGESIGAVIDTCYISKNENGLVTVKLKVDLSQVDPVLKAFVPDDFLNEQGNIDRDLHFKVTSEGIQDYYYSKGDFSKPFTINKHDWGVGQKWSFTTADGKTINREVTEKTGKDEWPLGFLLIKTTKIEETNPGIEGVSRVTFRTNHRFGLVYLEYELVTGQKIKIGLLPFADI